MHSPAQHPWLSLDTKKLHLSLQAKTSQSVRVGPVRLQRRSKEAQHSTNNEWAPSMAEVRSFVCSYGTHQPLEF